MKHNLRVSRIGVALAVVAGCGETASSTTTGGNVALGIAEFQIYESAELTTVVGVDPEQREIGRLELIHGRFMPTQDFGDMYNGRPIDGRKLTATVLGEDMAWETLGYSDTSHMPALPPGPLTTFVADPHVRPILQNWSIGWDDTPEGGAEEPYTTANGCDTVKVGSSPRDCSGGGGTGISCTIRSGSAGTTTTSACVGAAEYAGKTLDFYSGPGQPYDGTYVFLCCGSQISGQYGTKSCAAITGEGLSCAHPTDYCSPCGDSGGSKCQQCAGLTNYSGKCELRTSSLGSGLYDVCYDIGDCRSDSAPCSSNADCCDGNCCSGLCSSNSCVTCVGTGSFCGSDRDCCGGACCDSTCTTQFFCQ